MQTNTYQYQNAIRPNQTSFRPSYTNTVFESNERTEIDSYQASNSNSSQNLVSDQQQQLRAMRFSSQNGNSANSKTDGSENDGILSKKDFVDKYSSKKVGATTKLPKQAYLDRADLNTDGVISGEKEWAEAFRQVDKYDDNGDANTVKTENEDVAKGLGSLDDAQSDAIAKKPAYTSRELEEMRYVMEAPSVNADSAGWADESQRTDYLGRKLSADTVTLNLSAGAKRGMTLIHDTKSGRFYKQREGGKVVPLTVDEQKGLSAWFRSGEAVHPQEATNNAYSYMYAGLVPEEKNNVGYNW